MTPRSTFSVAKFEHDSILMFGGLENETNKPTNEVLSLNLNDFHMDCPFAAGEYPCARYGHNCCVMEDPTDEENNTIVFLGGIEHDYCTMDLFFLHYRVKNPDAHWEKIIEKTAFEHRISKQANHFIFDSRKYMNELQD